MGEVPGPSLNPWMLVDGQFQRAARPAVRADDAGLLGLGLFETVRVIDARAPLWPLHRDRLAAGLSALGLPWPPAVDASLAQVARLGRRNHLAVGECALRVIVTAGPPDGAPRTLVSLSPLAARVRARRQGTALIARGEPRALAGLKSLAWLAAQQAQRGLADHQEALILAPDGSCLEGSTTNLFALIDGVVCTPPADGRILPGIARGRVLVRCVELGLAVKSFPLSRADLLRAEEVWVTNALLPVAPAVSLDGLLLSQGTLHRKLAEGYDLTAPSMDEAQRHAAPGVSGARFP